MQNHLVYSSNVEQKVREYDTDEDPPEVGDLVILPFGPNGEMCPYRVVDRYFYPEGHDRMIFYIEVTPAS
jgi:hypothetical protein